MESQAYKVLILDDEYFLGEILSKALRAQGLEATAFTEVDTAIQALKEEHFDIVISDIYLPEKNGRDLFYHALENHPDLPFIFITGNPDVETAVDFLKKGAYDYLQKPFMLPELVAKVKDVIHRSHKRMKEKNLVDDLRQILDRRFEELRIYQDIFESEKDGLVIMDTEGIIVKVNPGFQNMTGLPESELKGAHLTTLEPNIFPAIGFDGIRRIIQEKGQWKEEMRARRRNGDVWIANLSFFPIYDETGKTFAYSAIITDVSDLRGVESALIDSLKTANLAQEAIIFGLARLAEYRDNETGFHLEKIRSYCKELAREMSRHPLYQDRLDEKFIDTLYRTAPLHDIGKVGIPDHILLKEGQLTEAEFEIMKSHTVIGYQTLESIRRQYGEMDFLNMGIEITYCHHERFDGKGYPRGLGGSEIPLSAQIVAIADVYDALTSRRVYKKAFSHQASMNTMYLERGKHFEPKLFDLFLSLADTFDRIRADFQSQKRPSAPLLLTENAAGL